MINIMYSLLFQGDKKCVESVCLAYSRLVDCFQNDPNRLQEIAGHGLLSNIQQLVRDLEFIFKFIKGFLFYERFCPFFLFL